MLQWDDLRFVLALARAGTLSQAARQLGVSHTTVARRLDQLEDHTKTRLFDRTPDGYAPTEAGDACVRAATRIEDEALALERTLQGRDGRLSGVVRLATIDALAVALAPALAAFAERYPEVRLELAMGYNLHNLTRRQADLALRMTNTPAEHLVGRRVATFRFAPFAAPALAERVRNEGIDRVPWLAWDARMGARLTEAWMREHVPDAPIACTLDDVPTMIAMLRANAGVAFLATALAQTVEGVVQVGPIVPGFDMDVWLLTHPDLRRVARIRALSDHIWDALQALCASDPAHAQGG